MKKLISILITIMLLLSGITPIMASEDTKSVNLHYSVSAKVTYLEYDGTSTTQKVDVGTILKEPKHKGRTGHTFQGWKNQATGQFWNFNDPVEEHLTLIACYKAETTENKDGTLQVGEGKISVRISVKSNSFDVDIQTKKTELLNMLIKDGSITSEELEQVAEGAMMNVVLEVKEGTTISKVSKTKLEQKAKEHGYQIGKYMDISLVKYLTVNGKTYTGEKIHKTSKKIKISIKIPNSMGNKDNNVKRTYCVIRNHEGNVELLDCNYDQKNQIITFETDRFSDYAIGYKDTIIDQTRKTTKDSKLVYVVPTKTGDTANKAKDMIILILSGFAIILLLKRKRKLKK